MIKYNKPLEEREICSVSNERTVVEIAVDGELQSFSWRSGSKMGNARDSWEKERRIFQGSETALLVCEKKAESPGFTC